MRPGASPERLLAFLLAAYAVLSAWDLSGRPACIDYYQFWVVGRAVGAKETTDVYSAAERKRLGELFWQRALEDTAAKKAASEQAAPGHAALGQAAPAPTKRVQAASKRRELETFSTPWFYTLFGLVSADDYDRSQDRFERGSLLAYVAAIVLLARLLGFSCAAACLWIVAVTQVFNPFVDDTIAGNVNRLQLLALALVLAIGGGTRSTARGFLAGALLGATLAFKPNLAAIAAVLGLGWLVAGERRHLAVSLAGLAAGAGAAVAASAAYFGSFEPWSAWLRELPKLMTAGSPNAGDATEGNFALARLVQDELHVTLGSALPAALFLAVGGALFVGRRRSAGRTASANPVGEAESSRSRDVLLLGVGGVLSLLASELAWQHYFVAAIPLAMFLLRPRSEEGGATLRGLALAALAMISLQGVGRLFDLHPPAASAAVVAGGTLLLFLLGLAEIARGGAARSPSTDR